MKTSMVRTLRHLKKYFESKRQMAGSPVLWNEYNNMIKKIDKALES